MRLIVVAVLVTSSAFAEDVTLKFRDAAALGGGGSVTAYVRDAHDVVVGAGAQIAVPAESFFAASAVGFLPRMAIAPTDGATVKLIPTGDENELMTLHELFYRTAGNEAGKPFTRPTAGVMVISLMDSTDAVHDPKALTRAIAYLQPFVPWIKLVERRPGQAMPEDAVRAYIYITHNIPDTIAGWAWTLLDGDTIEEAFVEVRPEYFDEHTLVHELVHVLGLAHLHNAEGLMSRTSVSWEYAGLTLAEQRALWLMQFREPGTRWPDTTLPQDSQMQAARFYRVKLACSLPRTR
ncbi:MAG: hypothetical protein AAB463_02640 [Patescibacteria group bacterium]